MGPAPRFTRCTVCRHAALTRGDACAFCEGALESADAPPDLFTGWRCVCWHCLWRPC